MRILIAEDDPVSRQLLETFLRKWGYEPVCACDGPEALAILARPKAPRMAILDWMMPDVEGPEVVRRIREREGDTKTPVYVILLTALGTPEDIVEGFDAGADDYVTKPFNKDELRARVRVGVRILDLRQKLADRVAELEEALKRVDTLQGLLPICSYCKKIRDDKNYWTELEAYFEKVSNAEFSHGVCPECYEKHLRPDLERMHHAPPRRGRRPRPAPESSP